MTVNHRGYLLLGEVLMLLMMMQLVQIIMVQQVHLINVQLGLEDH